MSCVESPTEWTIGNDWVCSGLSRVQHQPTPRFASDPRQHARTGAARTIEPTDLPQVQHGLAGLKGTAGAGHLRQHEAKRSLRPEFRELGFFGYKDLQVRRTIIQHSKIIRTLPILLATFPQAPGSDWLSSVQI